MFPYNLQETYRITPNAEAAEFIQAEVQTYFGMSRNLKEKSMLMYGFPKQKVSM